MAKYNHGNDQHRVWLAQNILSILNKWGFEIDTDVEDTTQEFVVSRWDKFDMTKKVIVYTSIDKRTGAIRAMGTDAIRVVTLKLMNNDENLPLFRQKIYRTGEFRNITTRMLEAVKKAQRARYNYR